MKAHKLPLISTLLVATICGAGFTIVYVALGEGLMGAIQSVTFPPLSRDHQGLAFTSEGKAVLEVNTLADGSTFDFLRTYRNLDGTSPEEPIPNSSILSGCYLWLDNYPPPSVWHEPTWENRLVILWDYQEHPAYWFLIHNGEPEGTAFFVGYDIETNSCVGYIGAEGFSNAIPAEDRRFELTLNSAMNLSNQVDSHQGIYYRTNYPQITDIKNDKVGSGFRRSVVYIQDDHRVYEVDLMNRQAKVLLDSPLEKVHKVNFMYTRVPDDDDFYHLLAVRTETQVYFFKADGEIEDTLVLPEKVRSDKRFVIYRTLDRRYFLEKQGYCEDCEVEGFPAGARLGEVTATFVALNGDILSEEVYYYDPKTSQRRFFLEGPFACSAMGPGLIYGIVFVVSPLAQLWVGPGGSYGQAVWAVVHEFYDNFGSFQFWYLTLFLLLGQVLGVYLAYRCYRRELCYASSAWERRMWTGLVFVFGLPGWVGYYAHRHWPALEECQTCEEHFPADREECPSCGAEAAKPSLRGSEIFAS